MYIKKVRNKFRFILILLGIILAFFGIVKLYVIVEKKVESLKSVGVRLNNLERAKYVHDTAINNLANKVDSLIRQNNTLFDMLVKDLSVTPSNFKQLEEICNIQIEEANNSQSFSQGYNCLSELYIKDPKSEDNILKAISNSSYALEAHFSDGYIKNLYRTILFGYENQVKSTLIAKGKADILGLLESVGKNTLEEIKFLEYIISLGIKDVSNRAQYRLSFIYQNGRSSINEKAEYINLFKALEYRKYVFKSLNYKPKKNIDIALIFDEGYSPHAATTIASILLNADFDTYCRFYIIEGAKRAVTPESKEKLASLKFIRDYDIKFITFPDPMIEKINPENYANKFFPSLVIYRVFLSKVLDLPKILYLDTDIVVKRDLTRLFSTPLKNNLLAGGLDVGLVEHPYFNIACGYDLFYINSGVLMLNLEEMRKINLVDKVAKTLENRECQFDWFDQDVINLTFTKDIKFISTKWNTSRDKFENRFINHYVSQATKPWLWPSAETSLETWKKSPESFSPSMGIYWYYRDLTPWTTKPQELDELILKIK
ncbi:MAG: Lipopolysaccharide 1,2-glucosyltransferase RfaJ [Rickettsiaceae bacterium]|jgi:lipopolysaccharide biosynthesis glycosyltransferase|nr:Lipopolysaccharide 1,2-glucosyltransferase RfaJ [Rickettsiaceae bacterium]